MVCPNRWRSSRNIRALVVKIHKESFKNTVLRFTGCPPNRRLEMFRPPPLVVDSRRPSVISITTTLTNMTTTVITSRVESLNAQPPSQPSPPPPPSLLSPLSLGEQDLGEGWVDAILQDLENRLMENDTNHEQFSELWSPLATLVTNSDENQQREIILPPPLPVLPNSRNDQGSENIPPPVPASAPFRSFEWFCVS